MPVLTAVTKQQFAEQGYLVVDDVLDPLLDLAPVWAEYGHVLDEIAEALYREGTIVSTYRELPFEARLIQVCQESGRNFPQHFDFSLPQSGVKHDTPIHVGPAVFNLLSSPRLLDVVEQIVGPEIYSNPVQHIRMKLPKRAVARTDGRSSTNGLVTKIPWHQDNGVILPEADEATILTVWMPLNAATIANGCLQVIPGSHRNGLEPHCPTGYTVAIPDKVVATRPAVPLPMRPSSVLLMTQRTIHSSLDNATDDQVRISLDLRYQPIGQPTGRPAFAAAGFVARSRAHPETDLHDAAQWAGGWLTVRDQLAEAENPTFNRWDGKLAVCA